MTEYQEYIDKLSHIFDINNVSKCHGIQHAITVMTHASNAIKAKNYNLTQTQYDAVILAALLHDADDSKFFPNHHNNENLRIVLANKPLEFVDFVVKMVNWVSSSKNGDSIPDEAIDNEWMLIPRYADRLEAIGMIGVERCFTYTIHKKRPLYTDETPRPKTIEEIYQIATEERYKAYTCSSCSMIDHFYYKLIRLAVYPISNPYFDSECKTRIQPLIDFVLKFGSGELVSQEDFHRFIYSD